MDRKKSERGGEQPIELGRPLGMQLHDVAGAHAFEEPLDIGIAKADAAV